MELEVAWCCILETATIEASIKWRTQRARSRPLQWCPLYHVAS